MRGRRWTASIFHRATRKLTNCFGAMVRGLSIQQEDDMAIEIRGMAPLLQVFDMPTSIAFYRDVLGFQVKTTSNPG